MRRPLSMLRTRVKICGITRPEDALAAARWGADAIGLVFYPPSPRAVTLDQALAVSRVLPAFVSTVALFVDPARAEVEAVLAALPVDLLQFHGHEAADFCAAFGRPYIKALAVREGHDVAAVAAGYGAARGILLDTYRPGVPGGTGETFDWSNMPVGLAQPLILAGGLNARNVAAAIRRVQPYAVDVSGGVERARGSKDEDLIAAFMQEVNRVGAS